MSDLPSRALRALCDRRLALPGLLVEHNCGESFRLIACHPGGSRSWLGVGREFLTSDAGGVVHGALVDDGASNGALLAAVRKAWGDPFAYVEVLTPDPDDADDLPGWRLWVHGGQMKSATEWHFGPEGEALCTFLLAAPVRS